MQVFRTQHISHNQLMSLALFRRLTTGCLAAKYFVPFKYFWRCSVSKFHFLMNIQPVKCFGRRVKRAPGIVHPIKIWKKVFLVCNMTYLNHHVIFPWGQILALRLSDLKSSWGQNLTMTFWGQQKRASMLLDEWSTKGSNDCCKA